MSVITLAEAKDYAGVSGTEYDDILQAFIDAVESSAERYLRRELDSEERTEVYRVYMDRVIVRHSPISSISAVVFSPDLSFYSYDTLDSGDYTVVGGSGLIAFAEAIDGYVRVTYTGGWTTLPKDLKTALLTQIKYRYTSWRNNTEAITQVNALGGTIQLSQIEEWIPFVKLVLDRYKVEGHGSY